MLSAYLLVWYLGNVYYNIYNKKACIALGKNAAGASNATVVAEKASAA